MIISIDIGTSYSSLCYLDKEGKAQPIEIGTGMSIYGSKYSLPSAVFVEDSGNVLIGQAAMNMRKLNPKNFRSEFKRDLGQNVPIVLGKRSFYPEDLYTEMFKHMKSCAERLGKIEKAVITYPASYRQKKCEKIQKAAKTAGLFNIELIDEPTAAAMNYGNNGMINENDICLVYDFGGGTFDVSLIQYQDGGFEALASPGGEDHCGGIDIDRIIFADVMSKIDQNIIAQLSGNQMYKMRFESEIAEQSVKIKHHLSQYDDISVQIPVGFDVVEYRLTREELNKKISGLVSRTIDCCRGILDDGGIRTSDLSGIVLVGGTSRIPLVRSMLESFAKGVKIYSNIDPELAVAQGAVCHNVKSEAKNTTKQAPEHQENPKNDAKPNNAAVPQIEVNQKTEVKQKNNTPSNSGQKNGCPANANAQVMKYYEEALKGSARAQYLLAEAMFSGEGCSEDEEKAFCWTQLSAKQGYADAIYLLGVSYEYGIGTEKNLEKAKRLIEKAAEKGCADAQFDLAVRYEIGDGVQQDHNQAFVLYKKAAEQGMTHAEWGLGECYYFGYGTGVDYNKAFYWFKKAAQAGDATAQNYVGICYDNGHGVNRDPAQAFAWYQKAADQGNAVGQLNLAVCYRYGEGVRQDLNRAFAWYKKSAEQGVSRAECELGECYYHGYGTGVDYNKAFQWFKKAADEGDPIAQNYVGVCYDKGHGVTESTAQSKIWYEKAADQGLADAQVNLGIYYFRHVGITNNYNMALDWFFKAASQGDARGQYYVGVCYDNGRGVKSNKTQAFAWYMKAADQGFGDAQYCIACCYRDGTGVTKNSSLALTWFKKAKDNGRKDAAKEIEDLSSPKITIRDVKPYVESASKRYNLGNAVYVAGYLDAAKIENARASYARNANRENILVHYDDTFWGGAKDGFLLTGDFFYWHNYVREDHGAIPVNMIRYFSVENNGEYISVMRKDGLSAKSTARITYGDLQEIVNFLNNIISYLNNNTIS